MLRVQCKSICFLGKKLNFSKLIYDKIFFSKIADEKEEITYCLPHGLEFIKDHKNKVCLQKFKFNNINS